MRRQLLRRDRVARGGKGYPEQIKPGSKKEGGGDRCGGEESRGVSSLRTKVSEVSPI